MRKEAKYGERAQRERGSRENEWSVGRTWARQLKRASLERARDNPGERVSFTKITTIAPRSEAAQRCRGRPDCRDAGAQPGRVKPQCYCLPARFN
jgi:hypothetical protein